MLEAEQERTTELEVVKYIFMSSQLIVIHCMQACTQRVQELQAEIEMKNEHIAAMEREIASKEREAITQRRRIEQQRGEIDRKNDAFQKQQKMIMTLKTQGEVRKMYCMFDGGSNCEEIKYIATITYCRWVLLCCFIGVSDQTASERSPTTS